MTRHPQHWLQRAALLLVPGDWRQGVVSEQRLFARLSGLFAAVAGVLAGIGIYGMMAGAIAERRREFGIRIALGARAAAVLHQVMRTAVWLAVTGVVVGVFAAAGLRRLIEARLYGVTGLDPTTIAAASCAIVMLSIVASLVAAVRATRIDFPALRLKKAKKGGWHLCGKGASPL